MENNVNVVDRRGMLQDQVITSLNGSSTIFNCNVTHFKLSVWVL